MAVPLVLALDRRGREPAVSIGVLYGAGAGVVLQLVADAGDVRTADAVDAGVGGHTGRQGLELPTRGL